LLQYTPEKASAEHLVSRTHPVSGRKGLFVNSTFTASIKGMKQAESDTLLNVLYRHIDTPDFSLPISPAGEQLRCGTTAGRSIES
jgi:alpha-ketoglutarate-dependent taurine dioxygenase